jgi:methanogenic corrinoid protein MtbC1
MRPSSDLPDVITAPGDPIDHYLALAATRELRAARELVMGQLGESGRGLGVVIETLLVPAMTETGARWYDGRWNAAQECLASGLTDSVLSAASVRARMRPPPLAPTVVLMPPAGDDHQLPARLGGELLAEAGADVIALSVPPPDRDLVSFLADVRPSALMVTCTWPMALPGVRDAAVLAHRAGVPVMVGGAGLGPDDRRARALGADAWAPTALDALPLLRAWREHLPSLATAPPPDHEVGALNRLPAEAYTRAVDELARRGHQVATAGEAAQVRADLRLTVDALASAVLSGDDRLFTEFLDWTRGLLAARRVSAAALPDGLAALRGVLGPEFPVSHRLLAGAAGR